MYTSKDFSGGGDSSFGLCPGVRFVTTRVASIGKSFAIDDAHFLTALSHSAPVVVSVLLRRGSASFLFRTYVIPMVLPWSHPCDF